MNQEYENNICGRLDCYGCRAPHGISKTLPPMRHCRYLQSPPAANKMEINGRFEFETWLRKTAALAHLKLLLLFVLHVIDQGNRFLQKGSILHPETHTLLFQLWWPYCGTNLKFHTGIEKQDSPNLPTIYVEVLFGQTAKQYMMLLQWCFHGLPMIWNNHGLNGWVSQSASWWGIPSDVRSRASSRAFCPLSRSLGLQQGWTQERWSYQWLYMLYHEWKSLGLKTKDMTSNLEKKRFDILLKLFCFFLFFILVLVLVLLSFCFGRLPWLSLKLQFCKCGVQSFSHSFLCSFSSDDTTTRSAITSLADFATLGWGGSG